MANTGALLHIHRLYILTNKPMIISSAKTQPAALDTPTFSALAQSHASQLQQLLKEREAEIKELQQKLQPSAQAGQDMAAEGQATPSEPENNMEAARRQIDDVRRILDDNRLWEGDVTGVARA